MGSSHLPNIASNPHRKSGFKGSSSAKQCCAMVFVGFALTLTVSTSTFAQSFASFGDQSPAPNALKEPDRNEIGTQAKPTSQAVNRTIAPPTRIGAPTQAAVSRVSYQQPLPTLNGPQPSQRIQSSQPKSELLYEDYLGSESQNKPITLHPTPDSVRKLRNSYSRDLPVARFASSVSPSTRLPVVGRQEDPFGENQKPPVAKPRSVQPQPTTMQPRATNPRAFTPPPNAFSPTPTTPRSNAFRQEDPFGDNQKQPTNTPPPRQEDPFGEKQKPPIGNPPKEPVTGGLDPQPPVTQPRTTPRGQLPNVRPTIDPASPNPNMQDPKLPPDAQGGNIRPTNPRNVIQPGNPTTEPRQSPGGQTREDNTPNFSNNPPSIDNSIAYEQGAILPERSPQDSDQNRNSGVYRPPSEVPQNYPRQNPQSQPMYDPSYQVVPNTQPRGGHEYFVPAFDPIPGLVEPQTMQRPPAIPSYQQPQPIHSMDRHPIMPQPTYGQPVVVNETYSPVVTGDDACQPCQTGYDACGEPIYPKPGFLRSLFMDDCQIASSEPVCNAFYFSFQGGWSDLQNMLNDRETELETETGSAFAFALGRINGRNLRTEVELAFRNNDISDRISLGASTSSSGDISAFSGMGNLYWEFVDFPGGRFRPYVGFGVGFASLEANLADQFGNSVLAPEGGTDTSFAYQWMAGMNYRANPNMDLFVEYRFFEADSIVLTSTGNISDKFNYQTNNVGIGLRWKF